MTTAFLPLSSYEHAWSVCYVHESKPGLVSEKPNVLVGQICPLSQNNKGKLERDTDLHTDNLHTDTGAKVQRVLQHRVGALNDTDHVRCGSCQARALHKQVRHR